MAYMMDNAQRLRAKVLNVPPRPRVYFAGKIASRDWRHDLTASLGAPANALLYADQSDTEIPLTDADYVGPFFVYDNHVTYHGPSTHGNIMSRDTSDMSYVRNAIIHRNMEAIRSANMIFAYLQSDDCYGTIGEIGMASSLENRIVVATTDDFAMSKRIEENLWHTLNMPYVEVHPRVHTNWLPSLFYSRIVKPFRADHQ